MDEDSVRKHRAPSGALRQIVDELLVDEPECRVRKHRAPKGALRLVLDEDLGQGALHLSESTEHHKVH